MTGDAIITAPNAVFEHVAKIMEDAGVDRTVISQDGDDGPFMAIDLDGCLIRSAGDPTDALINAQTMQTAIAAAVEDAFKSGYERGGFDQSGKPINAIHRDAAFAGYTPPAHIVADLHNEYR